MFLKRWIFLMLCVLSLSVRADMVVEGLQYPAWVERSGINIALAPGVRIIAGEQVITGTGGKVWLKMPDHARVKVGPEAVMNVGKASVSATDSADVEGTLQAALEVVQGAFRYTTTELSKFWRRDVNVRLGGTATIGIRGTDLWGQVDRVEQFVVLIEGRITVQPQDMPDPLMLQSPLQIYRSGEGLGQVGMDAVQELARITELDAGTGVMRQGGEYSLNLVSFPALDQARQFSQKLDKTGLANTVSQVTVAGRDWWRVSVEALASMQDAQSLRNKLSALTSISSAWISQS